MKKIILLIISANLLSANFIGMNNGARPLAMGNAFVALSDETTAIFYNPAGLARTNEYSLIASRQDLFGLSDLSNDMIGISFPTPYLRTGIAIQQRNYQQQLFHTILNSNFLFQCRWKISKISCYTFSTILPF